MKALLISLTLSFASFASHRVSQFIEYSGTVQGQSIKLKSQITNYNLVKDEYLIRGTMSMGGQSQSQDVWTTAKNMLTRAQVQDILNRCSSLGGQIETVAAVGESFRSCKLPYEVASRFFDYLKTINVMDGIVWIADVPVFGMVKSFDKKENVLITLSSYKR